MQENVLNSNPGSAAVKQRKFLVSGRNGKALYDTEKGKVFKLNAREASKFEQFSYKKTDLRPFLEGNRELKLVHVNLELTGHCNLKCRHCYGGKEFGASEKELSTEQWKKIIKEISEFNPKFLLFTGGECLLRKDFVELLEFTQNLGQNISVFSNLTLLTEQHSLALKESNAIVQFSAYSHTAELHDSITGVRGSFEKQQKALKKLKELGVPLHGQVILMEQNISSQSRIKKFFQKLEIPIEFSIARPSGRQSRESIPGCSSCSFPQGYLEAQGNSASIEFDFFVAKHFFNDCWIQRCGITPQGKVLACVFAREQVLRDLTKQSFKEVYEKLRENAAKYAVDHIEGCKDCSLRYACLDCRPWACSLAGGWGARNPYCKAVMGRNKFQKSTVIWYGREKVA